MSTKRGEQALSVRAAALGAVTTTAVDRLHDLGLHAPVSHERETAEAKVDAALAALRKVCATTEEFQACVSLVGEHRDREVKRLQEKGTGEPDWLETTLNSIAWVANAQRQGAVSVMVKENGVVREKKPQGPNRRQRRAIAKFSRSMERKAKRREKFGKQPKKPVLTIEQRAESLGLALPATA